MSLTNNSNYNFSTDAQKILQFFDTNGVELCSVQNMIQSSNLNDDFIKVYITYPGKGVVLHRPICPDKTNLISGVGDATENGFWIGMVKRADIVNKFQNLQTFADQLGSLFNLSKNSCCGRCNP